MKNIACVLLVALIVPAAVQAHPPKSVDVEFDHETKVLTVEISHYVDNPSKHYIDKIVVELNGDEIITQKLATQTDKKNQEVSYVMPGVQDGDNITIRAHCNISGTKEISLDVAFPEQEH